MTPRRAPPHRSASRLQAALLLLAAGPLLAACASTPAAALDEQVAATLAALADRSTGSAALLEAACGYAVFPLVGEQPAVEDVARAPGELHGTGGRPRACELLCPAPAHGGALYRQIVVFLDAGCLAALEQGPIELPERALPFDVDEPTARAAAAAVPIVVLTTPRGGLLGEVSLAGQRLRLLPAE